MGVVNTASNTRGAPRETFPQNVKLLRLSDLRVKNPAWDIRTDRQTVTRHAGAHGKAGLRNNLQYKKLVCGALHSSSRYVHRAGVFHWRQEAINTPQHLPVQETRATN